MDKVDILKIQDKRKIAKVTFKYPSLMNDTAEREIREDYQHLLDTEELLQEAREVVRKLEKKYNDAKEAFNAKKLLFELEFETIEKKHVTHETSVGLLGMGNDILGRKSAV